MDTDDSFEGITIAEAVQAGMITEVYVTALMALRAA